MNSKLLSRTIGCALGAALLLCGSRSANAQTSNSVVTFSVDMSVQIAGATFTPGTDTVGVHGTFNGWSSFVNLAQVGSSSIYTNTVVDTAEANGSPTKFQFAINPAGSTVYEQTADFNNRAARLPATSGGSLILPTPFFSDAGSHLTNNITFQVDMSQQIALGNYVPGTSIVEVQGNFNGWTAAANTLTNDPTILRTNQYGLVTSNVCTGVVSASGSTNASEDYKFVIEPGHYESPSAINQDSGGNRFFTLLNQPQTLPVVDYSDSPYVPLVTNAVTFQVDMSAQLLAGAFTPSDPVDVRGSFNNWSGGVNPCTNNPAAANTNIYSAVVVITDGVGAKEDYKFTFTGAGGLDWENPAPPTDGGNRFFSLPNAAATTLPPVFFSDLPLNSLMSTSSVVTFTVDMTHASEYGTGTPFDPATDSVYINADFLGWPGWNTVSLASYQMINNPIGSSNYSLALPIPSGNPLIITYKYGIYDGSNPNALDNEAGFAQNHVRYVRTLNPAGYTMPVDTFGNQFVEPLVFGELSAGNAFTANGSRSVPISWLGLPGVHLQSSSSLSGQNWVDHPETDGANWTNGHISNNGFISVTNWPTGTSKTFFRLVRPTAQ